MAAPSNFNLPAKCASTFETVHLEDEDEDFLPKLEILIDTLLKSEKKCYESSEVITRIRSSPIGNRNKLSYLRKCLISHRLQKAAEIIDLMISTAQERDHSIIVKNSLFVMENLQQTNQEDIMENLIRHAAVLRLNRTELLLEYLIYKLRNKNFVLPRDLIQKRLTTVGKTVMKNRIVDPLFRAYVALFDYMIWAVAANSVSDPESHFQQDMQDISDKIIMTWTEVITSPHPAIWDIFLEKLVQVLEAKGDNEKRNSVLQQYTESHSKHLNAYVYMEIYNKEQEFERRKDNLKKIVKMSPSDQLVLEYVDILIEEKNNSEAMTLLFSFLDYAINKEDLRGWTTLTNLVRLVIESKNWKEADVMRKLWKDRSMYWPQYHFDGEYLIMDRKRQAKICSQKCILLFVILKHRDHVYIQKVCCCLEKLHPRRFHKLNRRLQSISDI